MQARALLHVTNQVFDRRDRRKIRTLITEGNLAKAQAYILDGVNYLYFFEHISEEVASNYYQQLGVRPARMKGMRRRVVFLLQEAIPQ